MDSTEDYNENCELHVDDETKREKTELEEENQPSHVTLYKKETAEGDENGHLLRHERDPRALESVHRYANRIKSFLGWEPNLDEQGFETGGGESPPEVADENKAAEIACGSRENSVKADRDGDPLEEKEDDEIKSESLESERVGEAKPEPYLRADHANEVDVKNISPKSNDDGSENKDINLEVEDNNQSSVSLNSLPDESLKIATSDPVYPESKSVSEIKQNGDTLRKSEHAKLLDLEDSSTFGGVLEDIMNEVPATDIEVQNTYLPESGSVEQAGKEKIISDLEMDTSEVNVVPKDSMNNLSEPTGAPRDCEENESKESYSFENLAQSEDGKHLYVNAPLRNNIKKPYMDEIRRLSIDIVKDVIESARNSVQEMYVNKSDQETENECANPDNKGTTHVTNGNKSLETGNIDGKHYITDPSSVNESCTSRKEHESAESKDNMYQSKDIQDSNDTVDEETTCGLGSFKPLWIQKYATPRTYLLLFSIVGVLNGTYYAYFVSIMSTLEKRYAFKTKVSGTLLLADEITPLILGVIVGYVGGKTHRPRMVATGMLMSAVCFIISGMPYLIYGSAKHLTLHHLKNETGPELCDIEAGEEACVLDDRPPTLTVVGIFLLASFLKGFATLSYYVIGISYMDDNIKKKNTPLYLAVALALRLLGPLVGFLMSSAFLKIYENPFEDPGFGPDDPRWIGAWWMGFFLQGVLLVIFTLPIALFPRRLPSQKKLENFHPVGKKESMKETLAGLLSALKRLGKNPIFIIMIVNTTMKIFGHFGHSIMLPKYMENQFRLSAADASLFSGATSITCVMLSTVLGGFLIWKFRPRVKLLLAGMVISEIILCIGFLILMIPRCQPADMLHFGMNDEGLILDNVCNQNCDCSTTSFTPFCGPDGKTTYFSPCYAGCTQELKSVMSSGSKRHKEFGNCSCISVTDSTESIPAKITEGFCPDENCWSQTLAYLIILFVLLMISNTLTVAHTMILLRSVHPGDKSVALGTFETFICLFGFIPFPVTFGALVDSACLVWEESCGETGNCWFYDMEKYGYLLHGAAALFCSLSIVCLITLYLLSDRVRNLYAEETEEEDHIDNIKLDTVSGSVTKL